MTKNSTPSIPDPISALKEFEDRMTPFDQFEMVNANGDLISFAGRTSKGRAETQTLLNSLASNACLDKEDGSVRTQMRIVTDFGEPTGLGKVQVVALRTPLGDVLVVKQQALATWTKSTPKGEQIMPKYTVVALAKVDEDEAVKLIGDARAAQAANDAVVSNGLGSLDAGTDVSEADQAPAL